MRHGVLCLCAVLCLAGCNPSPPSGNIDLSGVWDGGSSRRPDDWGEVKIKATADGYVGTYSDTYNGQLGTFDIHKTGERTYKGMWGESDKKRHGTWEWEVSNDGLRISIIYKALDGNPNWHQGGKSILIRKIQ